MASDPEAVAKVMAGGVVDSFGRLREDRDDLLAEVRRYQNALTAAVGDKAHLQAEVERLREALREISLIEDDPLRASKTRAIIARAALAPEVKP